jgi:phosphoribosylcarboxyaminoimidazole (NCAIR) mutase
MDALLSTVQMPLGVPVATMAIGSGGAYNAAVFAVRILSLLDPELGRRYATFRNEMADEIISNKNKELKEYFANRGSK